MKISRIINVVRPEYICLRLKPNNSIRNNNTHKIARTIATLHRNAIQNIKADSNKVFKLLGKQFFVPTKISYNTPSKTAYMIYIEKQKVEFYFVIPTSYASIIREKLSDVWPGVTIETVPTLPQFEKGSTMYQMQYSKEDALSLAVDRRSNDLLHSTLNVIDVMEEGDRAAIFYNFMPISQFGWRSLYKNTIDKAKNNEPVDRDKTSLIYVIKLIALLLGSLSDTVSETFGKKPKKANTFEHVLERMNGGKQLGEATTKKARASVLDTQILVMSDSPDTYRQRNNARSLAQSFDTVSDDNTLVSRTYRKAFTYTDHSIKAAINKVGDEECQSFIALAGKEMLDKYGFIEKVETQETEVPEDLRKGIMCIGVNTFRGKDQLAYLTNDREYRNLTLVLIGPTRAGKSTLMGNLSRDGIDAGECIVIFDFIASCQLSSEIAALFTADKTLTIDCHNPRTMQGLGYNEVGISSDPFTQYDNAKKQTTQLMSFVDSINSNDTKLTAKMERYLTSAALIVFVQGGSIRDVFNVLQDHRKRFEFVSNVPASQKENLSEYLNNLTELDDYEETKKHGRVLIGTKDHLITGIVDRLNKMKANTYMEAMLKKSTKGNLDLSKEMQKNQLIVIRMPETMFATNNERDIYTTYWITKIWMSLQIREQRIGDRSKLTKVNLIIDELYQVENTQRFLSGKLSQFAKFGAKPIISAHYINQISYIREELRSANASYMLISGCDKKNFAELKDELTPFELDDLLKLKRFHSLNLIKNKESYAKFITRLPPVLKTE